jgi:hypothetical protein
VIGLVSVRDVAFAASVTFPPIDSTPASMAVAETVREASVSTPSTSSRLAASRKSIRTSRRSTDGVGSKPTQPRPGKNTSTHAWESSPRTTQRSSSIGWPDVYPRTNRAGTPIVRSMTAIADAK